MPFSSTIWLALIVSYIGKTIMGGESGQIPLSYYIRRVILVASEDVIWWGPSVWRWGLITCIREVSIMVATYIRGLITGYKVFITINASKVEHCTY